MYRGLDGSTGSGDLKSYMKRNEKQPDKKSQQDDYFKKWIDGNRNHFLFK